MYVISWQNGIDTELELTKTLGRGGSCAPWSTTAAGWWAGSRAAAVPSSAALSSGTRPEIQAATVAIARRFPLRPDHGRHQDIISMVWRKGVLNACMNPVCAVTGLT